MEGLITEKRLKSILGWLTKHWDKKTEALDEVNRIMAIDPRELVRLYVEPDFQAYNPANSDENEPDEEDMLLRTPAYRWLEKFLGSSKKRDGRHVAFILSDAGMGKTSILAMLRMMAANGQWPGQQFRLFKLGAETLGEIENIERPLNTVLLLDSLDEDRSAFGKTEERLEEILKATQEFRQVIVTCRTQFFPLQNAYERNGARIKIAGFTCKVIYLSLFSDRQVEVYLEKQFPSDQAKVERAEELLGKIHSLRMRPMLLSYAEDLLDQDKGESKKWTPFITYRAMVQAWLDREERKKTNQVKADQLLAACHVMAIELQKDGRREIGLKELGQLFQREDVSDPIREIDDIGGRSLLNLNSDGEYRFAHYSIQEFLVVDHMARYPEDMGNHSGRIVYTDELVRFLVDWSRQAEGWKMDLRGADLRGANLRDADLREADFSDANLITADLRNADLTGANLIRADLSGAVLHGADLSDADLSDADLSGANLGDVKLRDADLREADLRRADLNGAIFNSANAMGADLNGADLSGAELISANLSGADLGGANLNGAGLMNADLSGAELARTDLGGANFSDADLSGADFRYAVLMGANLVRAILNDASLRDSDLRDANLSGAELALAVLDGANLSNADLNGANLVGAHLHLANLRGTNLSCVDLSEAFLVQAYLIRANLRSANLRYAELRHADLSHADLRSADLSGANLVRAVLNSADLDGADLNGANLRDVNLSGAILNGANLRDVNLSGASLNGARNLTSEQLRSTKGNAETAIPEHITRSQHWGT